MPYKRISQLSAALLVGIGSLIGMTVGVILPSAMPVAVAQKQDQCGNFKSLSPIGQIEVGVSTYFSWTAFEEADEYILMIVGEKGEIADQLHISSEQTWIYYNLASIQINTKVSYQIYAQKKAVLLCSTQLEPVDPLIARLTGTRIPPSPTPYLMRDQDNKVYNFDIFTPMPTATPPDLEN